ncbi:MAG TPA: glutathione transferase GstA [Kofleriaceae bacterium]|nr:glutathione transferase GstA [Kofleriaceae bacterium]
MSNDYTLYYAPSACSISPHIALREAGLPFQLDKVDLRNKKLASGGDWLAINPKGYVPALRLPSGEILTEGAVMVQYIADQAPASGLAPPNGTMERVRLQEWLHFIATELHKGMSPFYNALAGEDYRKQLEERLAGRWALFASALHGKPFVMGDHFTIVDGYAFYVLRAWQHSVKKDLARWPELVDYYARLSVRPSVAASLDAEGITA